MERAKKAEHDFEGAMLKDSAETQIAKRAKALRNGGAEAQHGREESSENWYKEETVVGMRKRSRMRRKLSIQEKVDITYKAICMQVSQKDLAKEFRVTQACICNLVNISFVC